MFVDVIANDRRMPAGAAAVTSISTHVLRVTAPRVLITGPSIWGRVFHDVDDSDQVVFDVVAGPGPGGGSW